MPTVIILGFEYKGDLRSTITDIYQIYSFYRELGYTIKIITDIEKAIDPEDTASLLVSDTVDEHFIEFIADHFDKIRSLVKNKKELKSVFTNTKVLDNKLIFYYTGHGKDGEILLPDNTLYESGEFSNDVINIIGNVEKSELFFIFDCCNPHNIYLPFKYNDCKMDYLSDKTVNFYRANIISILSSNLTENTIAMYNESPFTKGFFNLLKNKDIPYDFGTIIDYVSSEIKSYVKESRNHKHGTISILSSSPTTIALWPWILTNIIDCRFDENLETLKVVIKK